MKHLLSLLILSILTLPALAQDYRGVVPDGGPVHYTGSINNRYKVEMKLTKSNGSLYGHYWYVGNQGKLTLNGTINADKSFVLNEADNQGKRTGVFRGSLYEGNHGYILDGTWSSPDGRTVYPFSLGTPD